MSTSDRPPAGGSVPRSPADDAAPVALSLPQEERLALARKLLAEGLAASNGPAGTSAQPNRGSAQHGPDQAAHTSARDGDSAGDGGSRVGGSPRDGGSRAGGSPRDGGSAGEGRRTRGRRSGARGVDPWADPDDVSADDDFPGSGSPRRRAGSIRRIAENDEVAEAAARKADSRAAAQAFAAEDELPSRNRDSRPLDPWADSDDTASVDESPGSSRGRGSKAGTVDPWGDSADGSADEVAGPSADTGAVVRRAPETAAGGKSGAWGTGDDEFGAGQDPDRAGDAGTRAGAVADTGAAGRANAGDAPRAGADRDAEAVRTRSGDPSDERGRAVRASGGGAQAGRASGGDGGGLSGGGRAGRTAEERAAGSGEGARVGGGSGAGVGDQAVGSAGAQEPRGGGRAREADSGAGSGGGERRQRRTVGRRGFGGGRGSRRGAEGPEGVADPELDGVEDPGVVARGILLDKLTGQPRTRAELADLLAEREIPDEVAEEVLDRFTEVGLIDDAAFANAWVESRHRGRGLGKRALAQELRRRGVDDELARDALDELDPEQEEETARALVRRKLRSMRSLDRQVAMRRLLGMLGRKGYPGGLAMTIVKQELDAGHEELPLLDPSGLEPD
ncbi:RecX family transcriptional regulator [Kribbella sp. CWNU-51]